MWDTIKALFLQCCWVAFALAAVVYGGWVDKLFSFASIIACTLGALGSIFLWVMYDEIVAKCALAAERTGTRIKRLPLVSIGVGLACGLFVTGLSAAQGWYWTASAWLAACSGLFCLWKLNRAVARRVNK